MQVHKLTKPTSLQVIVQHNNLINAQYDMGLLEMKIFLVMLAQIKRDDKDLEEYLIPVSFFYEKANGSAYQNIKKAGSALTKKNIEVEDIYTKDFEAFSLMRYCKYKKGEGYMRVRFNDDIKPYLLQLKGNFTMSNVKYIWSMGSVYSIRLYNLLRERKDFGGRTDSLTKLKLMLGISDKYTELYDFRKRILDVAVDQLSNTDLSFKYDLLREGRTVTSVKFTLTGKPEPVQLTLFEQTASDQDQSEEAKNFQDRALKILEKWGFSSKQIKYIMQVDPQKICQVSYRLRLQLSDRPISNPTGWAYTEFVKMLGI